MIFSMLALTAFAADKGKDYFQQRESEKSPTYKRAVKLFNEGCENIEKGFVKDTNKCIAAFALLKKIALKNNNTFGANFYLSQIYYYQPQSFNWRAKPQSKEQLKKMGRKYLKRALNINPNHIKAKKLYLKFDTKKASSVQTQGL